VRAEHHKAFGFAKEALKIAEEARDPQLVALSHWYLGYISYALGRFLSAKFHLEETIGFYDPALHHKTFISLRGVDGGVSALAYMSCCLWCLGYPDQALDYSQKSLKLARELGHPFSLADVLSFAGCQFNVQRRKGKPLEVAARELERLSKEVVPSWKGAGTRFRGEALVILGKEKEGIAVMREGITECQSLDVFLNFPRTLSFQAEAYINLGKLEEGLNHLVEAFDLIQQTGERCWEAELHRLQGKIYGLQGNEIEAEKSFHKAIEVAKRQKAKMWELRATVGLS
jgi:tetratricopeptide (TPR) repeat protein